MSKYYPFRPWTWIEIMVFIDYLGGSISIKLLPRVFFKEELDQALLKLRTEDCIKVKVTKSGARMSLTRQGFKRMKHHEHKRCSELNKVMRKKNREEVNC